MTSKGCKRKLSCYRSKQKNPGKSVETIRHFKPNYVKIISTDIDSDDELIDVENSSYEFVPIQENSQISSVEELSEIMDTKSYVDTDPSDVFTPFPNFKERCLQEIKQSDLLDVLIDKLHQTSQLHDFMCLLRDLKSGRLPYDNIVFLLLLECVKFQNCGNTVGM